MRILVTRPAEDAEPLAQRLAAMGHEAIVAPLLEVHFIASNPIDLDGAQAVLFTSANGVRAFCHASARRDVKALCVGDATRREAQAAGFADCHSADGDVEALAKLAAQTLKPQAGVLLHPAGSQVAGDLKGLLEAQGFTYRRAVLYEAKKADALPQAALDALKAGLDAVMLYSPRTGEAFAKLARKAGLEARMTTVVALCLSQAVADAVRDFPWRAVRVAETPDQDALLAVLSEVS